MFYLDRPQSTEPTHLFLRIYLTDGQLKYSVKEKVLPSNWNQSAGRVKKDTEHINFTLNKIDNKLKELFLQSKLKGPLKKQEVKNALDNLLGRVSKGSDFFHAIDQLIEDRAKGRHLTKSGKVFKKESIKSYKQTRNKLFKFNPNLTFESITLETYHELIAWFNKDNHALNTHFGLIKNLKMFLRECFRKGLHQNRIFEDPGFRAPSEQTADIYLSEEELQQIYKYDFKNEILALVRDWFIIDCYTGLRISDIRFMEQKHLTKDFIELVNEKTDTRVIIPIHPYVKAIFKKYGGLPRKIADQKMNQYLKLVAKKAGIKGTVLYSVTEGGKRMDYHIERWQMVSTHTARRSFITNLLRAGASHIEVMKLSGLKRLSTLQRYFKETEQELASRMKKHKFFK